MDTKSKKFKMMISWLCFFYCVIILIGALIFVLFSGSIINRGDYVVRELNDAFNPDFQNTSMFSRAMGYQLEDILDELTSKQNTGSDTYWNLLNQDTGKNILYSAGTAENPAEFTNGVPGEDLSVFALPKGYNFRLYFDGRKVTITKDGKNINVYGDGVYRSNKSMWYVPGYSSNINFNYPNMENMRVTMLVRKELVAPVKGRNSLSYIPDNQRNVKIMVCVSGVFFLLGIAAFAFYFFFRKDKQQADLALARFSGWFWWEFKALCTAVLIYLDFTFMTHAWRNDWFLWGTCAVISLFCYYLVINDIRYNRTFYKHNIFQSALRNYRRFETTRPFQKQMVNRFWVLLLVEFALAFIEKFIVDHFGGLMYLGIFCCILVAMVYLIYRYVRRFQNTVYDIGLLIDQISLVKNGDLTTPVELPTGADLENAVQELNNIRSGISNAVNERLKSERMKIDLITNVSHDIKTPLTSIISYIDLLKQEEDLPDYVKDYIEVLAQKSDRLKNMVQDIFDVSKATSGNLELHMETLDFAKLIQQTLADMNEDIEASGLTFKVSIPESPVMILADGRMMYRVFQNLICNALQYSLENSRVFVTLEANESGSAAFVKNTSRFELDSDKDLTERFVRGDSSRTTNGSGLGLSIARSFTEACGGNFKICTDADLFTAEVGFDHILVKTSDKN